MAIIEAISFGLSVIEKPHLRSALKSPGFKAVNSHTGAILGNSTLHGKSSEMFQVVGEDISGTA